MRNYSELRKQSALTVHLSGRKPNQLLGRMVDNGLDLEKDALEKIRFYLIRTYVKN